MLSSGALLGMNKLLTHCNIYHIYYRCGKTTLARLFAKSSGAAFKELSATESGISDLRVAFDEAKGLLSLTGRSDRR